MHRKTATLVGAAAALATGPALAATAADSAAVPVASSYAQLLEPIPNAVERLKIADAEDNAQPARVIKVQWDGDRHHHHHHHHHHNRDWYRQNGYSWFGGAWVLRRHHHHHHHHHHHNNDWR